jgi:hypothetical protein
MGNKMTIATDISGLELAIGSDLAAYQEVVRDEKSANCRARWPLLAQTAVAESTGHSALTDLETVIGQRTAVGDSLAARVAGRFDGVVRPGAAAWSAAPIAVASVASPVARVTLSTALSSALLERVTPALLSVVTRGDALSSAVPRLKAVPVSPTRAPARAASQMPGVAKATVNAVMTKAGPESGLGDLFRRLDASKQRGTVVPR